MNLAHSPPLPQPGELLDTFPDYQEMIARTQPDVVIVTTPNDSHFEVASFALKNGVDVIKEKPLALFHTQALTLTDLARHKGRLLMTCQQRWYSPAWLALKNRVDEIGQVLHFHFLLSINDQKKSWYWDEHQGGGAWLNMGWHAVQMVQWLLGEVVSIQVEKKFDQRRSWPATTDHTAQAQVVLKNGARGEIMVSCVSPKTETFWITGTTGSVSLSSDQLHLLTIENSWSEDLEATSSATYLAQLKAQLQAVKTRSYQNDLDLSTQYWLEKANQKKYY